MAFHEAVENLESWANIGVLFTVESEFVQVRAVMIEFGEVGLKEFQVRAVESFQIMIVEFRRDVPVERGPGIMPLLKEVSGGESDFAVNRTGRQFGEIAFLRGVNRGAEGQSGLSRE